MEFFIRKALIEQIWYDSHIMENSE
ncbi:prestin [Trichinella spiralis]|nr:prestin [Trichinella spiralis]